MVNVNPSYEKSEMNKLIILLMIVGLMVAVTQAEVLYSEDFQDSNNPQDITSATFGWTQTGGGSPMVRHQNASLSGGIDADSGISGVINSSTITVPTPSGGDTALRLSYDAYVDGSLTHNSGMGWIVGSSYVSVLYLNTGQWRLDARGIGDSSNWEDFGSGLADTAVQVSIDLDLAANTVQATVTDGTTTLTSCALPFTDGAESTLTILGYLSDLRSGWDEGMDIDNIILSTAPATIDLTSPNGGEEILAGRLCQIQWTSSNRPIGSVKIEVSYDNGSHYETIESSADNTGSYDWMTNDTIDSGQCLIRISDTDYPSAEDTSDNMFTVFTCPRVADLTGNDCIVDLADSADFFLNWLDCYDPNPENCP